MQQFLKTLKSVLDPQDQRAFGVFVVVAFAAGVIEVLGVGSIMPFIAVLVQPDVVFQNEILSQIYARLGFENLQQFMVFLGCVTLGIVVVSSLVNIFCVRYQLRVTHNIGHKWARRLLSSYLAQPYMFFLKTNTNALKAGVLSEIDRVVSSVLVPTGVIISKAMVILVILLLLVAVNPVVTLLLMLIVGGVYGGLLWYFRRKMKGLGMEAVVQNKTRFKTTTEAFASIRDVKLYNNAHFFEDKFQQASQKFNQAQAYSLFQGQIPKFIIEGVGFAALIGLALYFIMTAQGDAEQVIPLIALFAAAGYKLLPAAQNIYASLNSIRFNSAALSVVVDGMKLPRPAASSLEADKDPLPFQQQITLQDVGFSYANAEGPTLQHINLQISKNSLVAVVGATGAGKSTLVDVLIGLLPVQTGRVLVDDQALADETMLRWQRQIGYVPQSIYLLDGSIESNIAFGEAGYEIDPVRVRDAAAKAQIADFIDSLPDGYQASVGEQGDWLSGGQRQRIGIARALYRNPEVLVLDEPTSALDVETARQLTKTLKALSAEKTIVVISHNPEILEFCDQVLFLNRGHLTAAKDYASLMKNAPDFATVLKEAE